MADETNPSIFPALRYKDAPGAVQWLQDAFGFREQLVIFEEDVVAHAQLKIGNGVVMLGSMRDNPREGNPWDSTRYGIYVYVQDIEAHYKTALEAGAEIVRPLADTEYGSQEYSAMDVEGHLWSFGTYQPLE